MSTDGVREAGAFPKINSPFGESLCGSLLIRVSSVALLNRSGSQRTCQQTVSRRGVPCAGDPIILTILLILSPSFETGFTGFSGLQDYASAVDRPLSTAEWPFR